MKLSLLILSLLLVVLLAACTQTAPRGAPPTSLPGGSRTAEMTRDSTQAASTTGPTPERDVPHWVNLTIHSAFKTRNLGGLHPLPGNILVVVNMTVLAGDRAFPLNENTIGITGGGPITQKFYDVLPNPLRWGDIPPLTARTGETVFGVNASTQRLTVVLLRGNGNVILSTEIGTVPELDYAYLLVGRDLLGSTDFSSVVEALDTPERAAQYTQEKFTFTPHGKCTSYPPEEFFRVQKGDCKDYATFLSYVLASHGHDSKMIAFKYYEGSTRRGHVVTLLTEPDGSMKYATTPSINIWRPVTSIEDLFDKECKRLGIQAVANYTLLPAGSLDTCVL